MSDSSKNESKKSEPQSDSENDSCPKRESPQRPVPIITKIPVFIVYNLEEDESDEENGIKPTVLMRRRHRRRRKRECSVVEIKSPPLPDYNLRVED